MKGGLYIYKASAGAGKTYTLALYYLSIILSDKRPESYREVLAMTFTNKAAGEMKARIIKFLDILCDETKPDERDTLLRNLKNHISLPEDEIKQRASTTLHHMLHNYANFHIQTLDKFIQGIIKSFSKELGIPPQYGVDSREQLAIKQVIDQLLDEHADDDLGVAFEKFSLHKSKQGKSFKIFSQLETTAKQLLQEKAEKPIEQLKEIDISTYLNAIQSTLREISEIESELDKISGDWQEIKSSLGIDNKTLSPSYRKVVKVTDHSNFDSKSSLLTEKQQAGLENDQPDITVKNADESVKSALEPHKQKLREEILKGNQMLIKHATLQTLLSSLYQTAVLTSIEKALNDYKEEQHLLFFIDFNRIASNVIAREPVPFIFERTGSRYKHILLDEFQDNSERQWHNLLPLLMEVLSSGGTALIVGDDKQAIYRWRNGNAKQFSMLPEINLPEEFAEHNFDLKHYTRLNETLPNNFRSKKTIVEFNNSFFSKFAEDVLTDDARIPYQETTQNPTDQSDGYIQIEFSDAKSDERVDFHLDSVLNNIKDLRSRGYQFGDIAILVRKNDDGRKITDFLTLEHELPVISQETLNVDKSPSVQLLLFYLRYMNQPEELTYQIAILKYYSELNDLPYADLCELYIRKTGKYSTEVDILRFFSDYSIKSKHKTYISLSDLIAKLVDDLHIDASGINVQYFQNAVHEFESRDITSLSSFIRFWDENREKLNISIPDGTNAIRVMTIHKSKGLEFPAVIIPFLSWRDSVDSDDWIVDNDLPLLVKNSSKLQKLDLENIYDEEDRLTKLDLINMLYVAFTRPASELFIVGNTSGFGKTILKFLQDWEGTESMHFKFGQKLKYTSDFVEVSGNAIRVVPSSTEPKFSIESPRSWRPGRSFSEKQYGNLFHSAIARIQDTGQIESVVEELVDDVKGELSTRLKNDLQKTLDLPQINQLFQTTNESYSEVTLVDKNGDLYVPDRILMNKNDTYILEFKTGQPDPNHDKQISKYGEILSNLGENNVHLYLVYSTIPAVKEVCLTS